jgi:hypothetical protein
MALLRPHHFFKQSSGRIFLAISAVASNAKVGAKKFFRRGTLLVELRRWNSEAWHPVSVMHIG